MLRRQVYLRQWRNTTGSLMISSMLHRQNTTGAGSFHQNAAIRLRGTQMLHPKGGAKWVIYRLGGVQKRQGHLLFPLYGLSLLPQPEQQIPRQHRYHR